MQHFVVRSLAYLWASPYTAVGLVLGLVLGGKLKVVEGVFELHGRGITWVLKNLPVSAAAMTIGHTVWGRTPEHLERTRFHERVHVRQFERWGFFMGPAYVAASIYLYLRGRDYSRDNPFEVEAYAAEEALK